MSRIIETVDSLEELPPGSIVRCEAWGDVAIKSDHKDWTGNKPPTAAQLRNMLETGDESGFVRVIEWVKAPHGGQIIDCDGPFRVLYMPGKSEA